MGILIIISSVVALVFAFVGIEKFVDSMRGAK